MTQGEESAADMSDDEFSAELRWPLDPFRGPRVDPVDEPPSPSPATALVEGSAPRIAPSPTQVESGEGIESARIGRFVVDAFDRLAGRVLERLRALSDGLDSDLAEVRSELATLRQAVDDLGDRIELRQLRAAVDELRGDVVGLRRALVEWPDLERVSIDVAVVRSDLSALVERQNEMSRAADEPLVVEVAEVRRLLEASSSLPTFAPLIEEVSELRTEVVALRRRIALRGGNSVVELSEEQLQRLIVAVEARVVAGTAYGEQPRRR